MIETVVQIIIPRGHAGPMSPEAKQTLLGLLVFLNALFVVSCGLAINAYIKGKKNKYYNPSLSDCLFFCEIPMWATVNNTVVVTIDGILILIGIGHIIGKLIA